MKLNYKRTFLVGFAFLSICAFWQMYDAIVPLILTGTFKLNESVSGFIMSLDNIVALFLLPIFGSISDKIKPTKLGKRTPFILFGTIAAVILLELLPIFDNKYAVAPNKTLLVAFVACLGLVILSMGTYR
ncbi:MAG: MFS transporter, partial [Firmicutes bacterium]|nr:MFS transporter [Bacillota bacterium]